MESEYVCKDYHQNDMDHVILPVVKPEKTKGFCHC